ncbi:MAG: hypothetical protein AB7G80_08875 [Dongiaceae bacterium]
MMKLNAPGAKPPIAETSILTALRQHGGRMSTELLARKTQMSGKNCRQLLEILARSGKITLTRQDNVRLVHQGRRER